MVGRDWSLIEDGGSDQIRPSNRDLYPDEWIGGGGGTSPFGGNDEI